MSLIKRLEILELIEAQQNRTLKKIAEITDQTYHGIKSGRNYPNYETITKILNVIPRLNARWLILGEEPMFLPVFQDEDGSNAVHEPASSYMRRSPLYNYPILVEEVEEIRKSVEELRKSVESLSSEKEAAAPASGAEVG